MSFQKFLGLDCFGGSIPDESSICRFRHLLEIHDLSKTILRCANDHLATKGFVLKAGTIVDITLLQFPTSNRKHSSIRAKVEHPFRITKHLWGHYKLRYKGLAKNASRFTILCALTNIYFCRKDLIQTV